MSSKVGVALSSGGAFGAYQVGVLKAYVELGGSVDVLAGSSIGALNAAVLASAPSPRVGVQRLERIWLDEARGMLRLQLALASYIKLAPSLIASVLKSVAGDKALDLEPGLMSQESLEALLDRYIDADAMADGPAVYVSLYRSQGGLADLAGFALAEAGIQDTPKSEFCHLQSLSPREQREAVLASAALPMIFRSRAVGSQRFADGGLGGRQRRQGATPVDPLVKEACDLALVSHLGDGSPWSRDDYPSLTVVEIRPRKTIERGFLKDLFEQDPAVLASWLQQGYGDARAQLGRVLESVASSHGLRRSEQAVLETEAAVQAAATRRRAAMSRLDGD